MLANIPDLADDSMVETGSPRATTGSHQTIEVQQTEHQPSGVDQTAAIEDMDTLSSQYGSSSDVSSLEFQQISANTSTYFHTLASNTTQASLQANTDNQGTKLAC
jgi:hypothetical protein